MCLLCTCDAALLPEGIQLSASQCAGVLLSLQLEHALCCILYLVTPHVTYMCITTLTEVLCMVNVLFMALEFKTLNAPQNRQALGVHWPTAVLPDSHCSQL